MLGHKMFQILGERFPDTICTIRASKTDHPHQAIALLQQDNVLERVRADDHSDVVAVVREVAPDVVVNCIGVVKQRPTSRDAITSITINSLLPHRLAEVAADVGARLIHFSTDCVFDGSKGAYREEDRSNATDLYGRTKYLGEVAETPALTLRTSIIGRELTHHDSLLEWFLRQKGRVDGYKGALYSGLTTNRLAELVGDLIESHRDLTGMYHVAGPWISKYDLLLLVREAFALEVDIEPRDQPRIDRTLVADRFAAVTGYQPPTWRQMTIELANDPTPYESWLS
jgi:dTDP-4-dehydrorhamnose reductase